MVDIEHDTIDHGVKATLHVTLVEPEPGLASFAVLPYDCEIIEARLYADVQGSLVVDIWRAAAGGIPTDEDSIVGATPPTLSAQQTSLNEATDWSTSLSEGDVLAFNVVGTPSGVTLATLALLLRRPGVNADL